MFELEQNRIRAALDDCLSGLDNMPSLQYKVLGVLKGETKMKRKGAFVFALTALLTFALAVGALAASGALDALKKVWEDSFARMNTTGEFSPVDNGAFDQQAFEKEYGGIKEDLVISTVPGENDMPLEKAQALARQTILDTFGTPAGELDAMGVYPSFIAAVYQDEPSEWEFYFTGRRDVNIDEDHTYEAPGEYRVTIESPSGEILMCNWYNDAFWPEYARRTWEAGNHQYVYSEALRGADFFKQPMEDRKRFEALFAAEGLDVTALQDDIASVMGKMEAQFAFLPSQDNLMGSSDARVAAALAAIEKEYGLAGDVLDRLGYAAHLSPLDFGTEDIVFSYNYNLEFDRFEAGQWGRLEQDVRGYAARLGSFLARFDKQTGALTGVVHAGRQHGEPGKDPALLLGKPAFTAADVPQLMALTERVRALDRQAAAGSLTEEEARKAFNALMLEAGGPPERYQEQ